MVGPSFSCPKKKQYPLQLPLLRALSVISPNFLLGTYQVYSLSKYLSQVQILQRDSLSFQCYIDPNAPGVFLFPERFKADHSYALRGPLFSYLSVALFMLKDYVFPKLKVHGIFPEQEKNYHHAVF